MKQIYLIGSLRNPGVPKLATDLRKEGFDVFDDWYAPGPEADDFWQKYEQGRGRSYGEALQGYAGRHIFNFDRGHLDGADLTVLLLPAGKSCHLEFGYMIGSNKPGYILFDKEPERWDIMYQFATGVFFKQEDLFSTLRRVNDIDRARVQSTAGQGQRSKFYQDTRPASEDIRICGRTQAIL